MFQYCKSALLDHPLRIAVVSILSVIAMVAIVAAFVAGFDERNWSFYNKLLAASDLIYGALVLGAGAFVLSAAIIQARITSEVELARLQERARERDEQFSSIVAQTAIELAFKCIAVSSTTQSTVSNCREAAAEHKRGMTDVNRPTLQQLMKIDTPSLKESLDALKESISTARRTLQSVDGRYYVPIIMELVHIEAHSWRMASLLKYLQNELPGSIPSFAALNANMASAEALNKCAEKLKPAFVAAATAESGVLEYFRKIMTEFD